MAMQNQVDEAAIQKMIAALNRTDADCDAASRAVTGATEYLTSVWTGDAAKKYNQALGDWIAGLHKVQQGVRELNDAMTKYYQTTNNIESDAYQNASWT